MAGVGAESVMGLHVAPGGSATMCRLGRISSPGRVWSGSGGRASGCALWLSQFHWATVLQLVVLELLLLSFWSAAEGPLLCAGCMLAPALLRPVQSTQNQLGPWAGRTGTSLGVYSL